jgi:hypothetical protein
MQTFFFILGVVNNVCLIVIFTLRARHLKLIERFGWLYLLLAIPTLYGFVLAAQAGSSPQYSIFLGIFLAFLAIEWLYDWVLKVPFRETMDWRLLIPYAALYVASSYGFVIMVWKYDSVARGILMLVLTAAQVLANVLTHPRDSSRRSPRDK